MRKIIHVDMDAFFAAVEMRDNPKLRNVPMAIGGRDRRGVLCTSNYEARKFGVRSAMPGALALKLCPQLILIPPHFEKYKEASAQVFEIFHQYTDKVEGMSLDEAYLDVTDSPFCQGSATLIAQEIRKKIFDKTQLTASAGVAPNKLLAKLASDINKPNGLFTITPQQVEAFIKDVKVERIWGVGKVTKEKMHEMGIKTCLDLQHYSRAELTHIFGKFGDALFDFCRGKDDREVESHHVRKSLGSEETFLHDIESFEEMKVQLLKIFQDVKEQLMAYEDRQIKNIFVKIKYPDFKQTTIERQIPFTEESVMELFAERWPQDPRAVRLLGVGVKFEDASSEISHIQLPLFALNSLHE